MVPRKGEESISSFEVASDEAGFFFVVEADAGNQRQ